MQHLQTARFNGVEIIRQAVRGGVYYGTHAYLPDGNFMAKSGLPIREIIYLLWHCLRYSGASDV